MGVSISSIVGIWVVYFRDFLWGGIERRTRVLDKMGGKRK